MQLLLNNETYFAQAGGSILQGQSAVYKWSGESFSKLQTLPPALEAKFFNINEQVFLALNSYIYKWEGRQFTLFQSISTLGSWARCVHSDLSCVVKCFWVSLNGRAKNPRCKGSLRTSSVNITRFRPLDHMI